MRHHAKHVAGSVRDRRRCRASRHSDLRHRSRHPMASQYRNTTCPSLFERSSVSSSAVYRPSPCAIGNPQHLARRVSFEVTAVRDRRRAGAPSRTTNLRPALRIRAPGSSATRRGSGIRCRCRCTGAPRFGVRHDFLHDRAEAGDGAGAQAVAVAESARQDRAHRQFCVSWSRCQSDTAVWPRASVTASIRVDVAVGSRERDDAERMVTPSPSRRSRSLP